MLQAQHPARNNKSEPITGKCDTPNEDILKIFEPLSQKFFERNK